MGIRETTKSTTPVMNWDQESSLEKGISTDDSVGSLVSFPKVHESLKKLNDTRETVIQGPEGQTIGMKRKPLTTKMNSSDKPKARRRNPERGNDRTPRVLSSRQEPAQEVLRRREYSDHTEGRCQRYPGTSADTLESARGEIMELRKGLKSTLHQLDIYEANGGHKSPYIFPEVKGILNHVMELSHTHTPPKERRNISRVGKKHRCEESDAGRNGKLRRRCLKYGNTCQNGRWRIPDKR